MNKNTGCILVIVSTVTAECLRSAIITGELCQFMVLITGQFKVLMMIQDRSNDFFPWTGKEKQKLKKKFFLGGGGGYT